MQSLVLPGVLLLLSVSLSLCSAVSWVYFEFKLFDPNVVMHMRGVRVDQCHTDKHFLRLWEGSGSPLLHDTHSYRFRSVNGSDLRTDGTPAEVILERFANRECLSPFLSDSSALPRLPVAKRPPRISSAGNWTINSCAQDLVMNSSHTVCLKIIAKDTPPIIGGSAPFSENQFYDADPDSCAERKPPPDLFSMYRSQACLSTSESSSLRIDCPSLKTGLLLPSLVSRFNQSRLCEGEPVVMQAHSLCGPDNERLLSFDYDIFGDIVTSTGNDSNYAYYNGSGSSEPSVQTRLSLVRRSCGDGSRVNWWFAPTFTPTQAPTQLPSLPPPPPVHLSFAFTLRGVRDAQGLLANSSLTAIQRDWERLVRETVSLGRLLQSVDVVFLSAFGFAPFPSYTVNISHANHTSTSGVIINAVPSAEERVRVTVNVMLSPVDSPAPPNAFAVLSEASSLLQNISSSQAWKDFRAAALSQYPQFFSANLSLSEPLVSSSAGSAMGQFPTPTAVPTASSQTNSDGKGSRKRGLPTVGVILLSVSLTVMCLQLVFTCSYCLHGSKVGSRLCCAASNRVAVQEP